MDNIKNIGTISKNKWSKVLDKIKEIKEGKLVLNTREQKHNYINSLRSTKETVKIEIKMKKDFEQTSWPKIKLLKWKRYDIEIGKYDLHTDWQLAVSWLIGWTNDQVKIFTDRFDIIAEKEVIWNTWIIDNIMIVVEKADWDLDWMAWFIKKPEEWKGVASFTNLRGQNFYLVKWDEIRFNNTDNKIILWEIIDNRDLIDKVIASIKQWENISKEKYDEINSIFSNWKYSEISKDEYYKWKGERIIFDSRDEEGDLCNQIEIINTDKDWIESHFVDYIY